MSSGLCIGVLIPRRSGVYFGWLLFAYSMARGRVTAFKSRFSIIQTAAPTPAIGWSTSVSGHVDDVPVSAETLLYG